MLKSEGPILYLDELERRFNSVLDEQIWQKLMNFQGYIQWI